MSTRFSLGSRFYIFSNDDTPLAERAGGGRTLIVVSHGYYKPDSGTVRVSGLEDDDDDGYCAFLAREGRDAGVGEFSDAVTALLNNPNGNGGFNENRANLGQMVTNYTLVKGMNKSERGNADYRYVDTTYINAIYPAKATFDMVSLHNSWGRTEVKLGELFASLSEKCPNVYSRLFCGFCRESLADAKR